VGFFYALITVSGSCNSMQACKRNKLAWLSWYDCMTTCVARTAANAYDAIKAVIISIWLWVSSMRREVSVTK